MNAPALVEMRGIGKRFGPVQALRGADFTLAAGEVHALLGENGAGKSTLMHILYGVLAADAGTVAVGGQALTPGSTRAARAAGVGMVHQHFSLVAPMTVAENVALGRPGWRFDRAAATRTVQRVGERTGLRLDPAAVAGSLPAGLRQRLEIVKALAHDARVLVLDEPTAALAPSEVRDLFTALRTLVAGGLGVVLITHKLPEVAAIAGRVTVLRRGEVVLTGPSGDFDAPRLARAMIGDSAGDEMLEVAAAAAARGGSAAPARDVMLLEVAGLSVPGPAGRPPLVRDVSLDVRAHEIVGIAAVEGNGQRELMRAIVGLLPHEGTVRAGRERPAFIPEDRQHEGLVLDFDVMENMQLGAALPFLVDHRYYEHEAATAIDEYQIRTAGPEEPVRSLSGGNQQKVVLARELLRRPALLIAENPTRGLDVRATADVHQRLRRAAREQGLGVLLYSTDLDEVLALSDRVGVMVSGTWRWVAEAQRDRARVGAMMLGDTA